MLILTRRPGERVVIGPDIITVTVLGVFRGQVRLGIDAPPDVSVHREEVYRRIEAEGRNGAPGEPGTARRRDELERAS